MWLIYVSSCLIGFFLIWFSFRMREGDWATIAKIFGCICNLPLLGLLFRLYHCVLEPLMRSAVEEAAPESEA